MDLDSAYKEHVTQYSLHNPEQFKLNSFTQNEISFNTEWRWVLDTEEDFEFIQYVFSRLYNNDGSLFRVEDIFNLITREKTV